MINWLFDYLIGWLIDYLIELLIDLLVGWLVDGLIDWNLNDKFQEEYSVSRLPGARHLHFQADTEQISKFIQG